MTESFDIYLASASPRRRELLGQIGVSYRLLEIDEPEVPRRNEAANIFVQRMALNKARAGFNLLKSDDSHPVLGADTVVVLDGEIMGKPENAEHGKAMLAKLAGQTHQVMSAVALMGYDKKAVKLNTSTVRFCHLDDADIEAYWALDESHDKAGAYAVQGQAARYIEEICGSYSGIMGLPLFETARILQEFGITPY